MAAEGVGFQIGLHGVLPAAGAAHVFTGFLPGFQIGKAHFRVRGAPAHLA